MQLLYIACTHIHIFSDGILRCYSRHSIQVAQPKAYRESNCLLLVILSLILSVLTSCTTTEVVQDSDLFRDTLVSMIPALPDVPSLSQLEWHYLNGMYCLDETNVDRLLDFGENILPRFRWELSQYQKKLDSVIQAL